VAVTADSLPVTEGWNLIGSIATPVAVSQITSDPPGISTSRFFGYADAYFPSDSILPGKGYWVKAWSPGVLHLTSSSTTLVESSRALTSSSAALASSSERLTSSSTSAIASRIVIIPLKEMPPPPPDENRMPNGVPGEFKLRQNYPNPFNPVSTISFDVPRLSFVSLRIYDILGREVATLVNEMREGGRYIVRWDASGQPSGVYFCRLNAGTFTETRKLLLVR
jgi:hypothetical protein